jgi:serine protease AprX
VIPIPAYVVEYFLLGRTRREAVEHYTQDGGIVSDVWLRFARVPDVPQKVLVAPFLGVRAVDLGYCLHRCIDARRVPSVPQATGSVSPLENYVVATLYLDDLLRVVLPMTTWWHDKNLHLIHNKGTRSVGLLDEALERAIRIKLGKEGDELGLRKSVGETEDLYPDRRILLAAPLAGLIGVFRAAESDDKFFDELKDVDPRRRPDDLELFTTWVKNHAEAIATAARQELSRPFEPALLDLRARLHMDVTPDTDGVPPEMIQRVFLDRDATLADAQGNATIKADAAERVFDISCRPITWAVLDSGIAATHPAFQDRDPKASRGRAGGAMPTRIKGTFDFTLIREIRNFDLVASPKGTPERDAAISALVAKLQGLPGRPAAPDFIATAIANLNIIADQLENRIPPDWGLIETLVRRANDDDGASLCSDHGTHVAGILAADWRSDRSPASGQPEVLMLGVCPDINLYDLRVVHPSVENTEFAVLAALEFVQYLNTQSAAYGPIVHGVNISMSIPHDVRSYGCGATPVCVACDRLAHSGVVVVAAAGNRGWNEQESGFGSFSSSSITDPGNAEEVITVGATHRLKPHTYGVSYFSSRGPTGDGRVKPDLVAPGEGVRGPIRGDADDDLDGTSMAAPFVSGAAALLLARHPELIGKPARVKQILCSTATDLGRERYFQGHGLVDVLRALQSV